MGMLTELFDYKAPGKGGRHADCVRADRVDEDGSLKANTFCPTGDGGGVDPSCGKGGDTGSGGKPKKMAGFELVPGVRAVKKAPDFEYTSTYHVTLDNGDTHSIYFDRQSGIWHHANPKGTRVVDSYLATQKGEVLSNLVRRQDGFTANTFCPTGPGGGVDATCSPNQGGASEPKPGGTKGRGRRSVAPNAPRGASKSSPSVPPGPNAPAVKLLKPEEIKEAKARGLLKGSLDVLSTARASEIRDTLSGKGQPGGAGASHPPGPGSTGGAGSKDGGGPGAKDTGFAGGRETTQAAGATSTAPVPAGQVDPAAYAPKGGDKPRNTDLPPGTWPAGLSAAEKGAVAAYTSSEYKVLNSSLRSTGQPPERLAAVHGALESALSKVPVLDAPVTLHRGLDLSGDGLKGFLASVVGAARAGQPLRMGGWLSTVPGEKPAEMEMFNVHLKINAVHCLDTTPASRTPYEREAVMHHAAEFRPRSVRKVGDTYHVELDQLPPSYPHGGPTHGPRS